MHVKQPAPPAERTREGMEPSPQGTYPVQRQRLPSNKLSMSRPMISSPRCSAAFKAEYLRRGVNEADSLTHTARTSSRGVQAARTYKVMTIPGVQKPHWEPLKPAMRSWMGWKPSGCVDPPSPLVVVTALAAVATLV